MYSLLIADDEQWIRQRIVDTVDWASVGVGRIYQAADGEQALEQTIAHRPDIIITDIRMPGLTGLDFINIIKEKGLHPKVIFLSGYSDFEYAQRALQLGAHDYLLKPASNDEFLKIVRNCIEEIKGDAQKEKIMNDLMEKLENDKPVLKQHFLLDILNGYIDEQTVGDDLEYFALPTEGHRYACLIIQQDKETTHGQSAHLLQLGIKNVTDEFLSLLGECEAIFLPFGEIVCILSLPQGDQDALPRIEESAGKIKDVVKKLFGLTVTIGLGGMYSNILDLSQSFEQAKQAALYRAYLGGDSVYRFDQIKLSDAEKPNYSIDSGEWLDALKKGRSLEQKVDRLVDQLAPAQPAPVDLKSLYMEIIQATIGASYELSGVLQDDPMFNLELFSQLNKIGGPGEFRDSLLHMLHAMSAHLQDSTLGSKKKVVQMVVRYIEEHYREPITLTDAANEVYLNPTYLCKIFKSETGFTFTKYIMNYRIKKAVELMNDPKLKIYEIAELVGYSDVQYFTKLFKSQKGMSPTQYRDKIV